MLLAYLRTSVLMMRARPIRSALSLLGIYIGVTALALILGIREGIGRQLRDIYKTRGAGVIFVEPAFDDISRTMGHVGSDELQGLLETPGILSVLPRVPAEMEVRAGPQSIGSSGGPVPQGLIAAQHAQVLGIDTDFIPLYRIKVLRGRIFLPDEVARKQPVCLLSAAIAHQLFPLTEPVGSTVEMKGIPFQIIGVVDWDREAVERTSTGNIDILVPAGWTLADSGIGYMRVEVRVQPGMSMPEALAVVTGALSHGNKSREKLYYVRSLKQAVEKAQEANDKLMAVLLGIAAISLLVGGIGVANVMVISVTERTREVGIRKALGARRVDILLQFLVEASVLCVTGGILAVASAALGITICTAVFQLPFPIALPLAPVAGCLLLTVLIGLLAGVYPASRAAMMSPAEALRYE